MGCYVAKIMLRLFTVIVKFGGSNLMDFVLPLSLSEPEPLTPPTFGPRRFLFHLIFSGPNLNASWTVDTHFISFFFFCPSTIPRAQSATVQLQNQFVFMVNTI